MDRRNYPAEIDRWLKGSLRTCNMCKTKFVPCVLCNLCHFVDLYFCYTCHRKIDRRSQKSKYKLNGRHFVRTDKYDAN